MANICESDSQLLHAFGKGLNPVDAGQNQPVIFGDFVEGSVERLVGRRLANLDEWNFDDVCA